MSKQISIRALLEHHIRWKELTVIIVTNENEGGVILTLAQWKPEVNLAINRTGKAKHMHSQYAIISLENG